GGERDPELDGRDGAPAPRVGMGVIEAIDRYPARREIAGLLQLFPYAPDPLRVLHRLPVVGRVAFAIEVSLAHDLRRKSEVSRDAVQNILDHQHALRPAEAAERGLRSLM